MPPHTPNAPPHLPNDHSWFHFPWLHWPYFLWPPD